MNKQHVQLPNNMTLETILTPQDLLVYVSIKRYMNNETKDVIETDKEKEISEYLDNTYDLTKVLNEKKTKKFK